MPNAYQEDYERIRHSIESTTKRLSPDTAILAIMGAVAVTVAGALIHADMAHADAAAKTAEASEFAASGAAAGLVQPLYAFLKGKAKGAPPSVPNPWFVWNGIGDAAASPISRKYVKQRRGLLIAGAGVAIASAAASTHTAGVNVGAAVTHANAAGSTLMHIAKLQAIANNYRQSRTIAEWLKVVNGMKAAKGLVRGGQLVGALIPGGSLPAGIAAAVAKTGIKLSMMNVCFCTAAAIHWRAYQEQAISKAISARQGSFVGPGSQIFGEILRGVV
ncbi:MAG: hypothetical protein ACREFT_08700 [Acetobacteraceae bacterium]